MRASRWRGAPRLAFRLAHTWREAAACGAVVVAITGGLSGHRPVIPASTQGRPPAAVAGFRRIILPDLVVIAPRGLVPARLARLAAIRGVSGVLPVDGATISVGGRSLNALGVSPREFRSWTPLRTASNQRLWNALVNGGFVASPQARRALRLRRGASYRLTGSATVSLRFGGAAPLGVAGVGLLVSDRLSARLGLIHNVAALIAAPARAMPALRRQVRAVLGGGSTMITVRPRPRPVDRAEHGRGRPLPVDRAGSGRRPATYLQLFKESAALYCPSLSWTVLAAIGQIESGDGANNGPSSAGALGPMQFLPSTWQAWGITAYGEPGPPNVMDPYDAVPSAARYLCAAGAASPGGLSGAIYAYNHAGWYVAEVLALARSYASTYG